MLSNLHRELSSLIEGRVTLPQMVSARECWIRKSRHAASAIQAELQTSVLAARDITKTFREGAETVPVLRGISMELHAGEIVALEGPSGSGKTTLLSILGCILTPSDGELVIAGEQVDRKRPEKLPMVRKKSIGFVFQQFNLFPALTALENVEYALNVKGLDGKQAREEAPDGGTEDKPVGAVWLACAAHGRATVARRVISRGPGFRPRLTPRASCVSETATT